MDKYNINELPEEELGTENYFPPEDEKKRLNNVYDGFSNCYDTRSQTYHYFNDRGLDDMINDAVKRYNSYLPPRDEDEWRSQLNMGETRDKIMAILSFIGSQRMREELSARDKNSTVNKTLSSILQGLYDYSMDAEKGDMKFTLSVLEVLTKGTVINFEGYERKTRNVRYVESTDQETGISKFKEKEITDFDGCFSKIIPLEDFFVPNFYELDIQNQERVYIQENVPKYMFDVKYKKYANHKYVKSGSEFSDYDKEANMFFYNSWSSRVEEEYVEVLHCYVKEEDRHDIVANGVLLTEPDNPFIFNHKNYPFAKAVYEYYAPDFFYGMGLAIKLMNRQDVSNTLHRMFLDRTYLSVMPWFVTSLSDEIEESEIGPMQRIQVSDVTQFREGDTKSIQGGDIQMADRLQDSMNISSIDPAMQGNVSSATATSVMQARESNVQIMSLFLNNLSWMRYDQAKQRIANLLQFSPKPNADSDDYKVKEIRQEGQTLSDGTKGIKIIRLIRDSKVKKGSELDKNGYRKKFLGDEETGDNTEVFYITCDKLRNIDYDIKIVPTSSVPETQSMQKAMVLEYANAMSGNEELAQRANWEAVFGIITDTFNLEHTVQKEEGQVEEEQATAKQEEMQMAMMTGKGPGGPGPQGGAPPDPRYQNSELVKEMAQTQKPGLRQMIGMPPS